MHIRNALAKLKKQSGSIYSVFFVYFFVLLIFISLVSLVIIKQNSNQVIEENISVLSDKTRTYFDYFEKNIISMMTLQVNYVNEKSINDLAGRSKIMTPYQKMQAMKETIQRLSWITSHSEIVSEASVYFPEIERIISANESISEVDEETRAFLLSHSSYSEQRIIEWDGKAFIVLPFPGNPIRNSVPNFVLYLELSTDWIKQTINDFTDVPDAIVTFCHMESGFSVYSDNRIFSDDTVDEINRLLLEEPAGGEVLWNYGNKEYIIVYQYSETLDALMYVCFQHSVVTAHINKYRGYILIFAIFVSFMLVFYTLMIFRTINQPIKQLVSGLKAVEMGNLDTTIQTNRTDEFGYVIGRFNRMCVRMKETIQQVYEEKIHTQQAEMKQLQYQINPHFLYNSLYIIRRMAKVKDYENIDTLTRHLARYYKYITASDSNKITLEQEIIHAMDYINIQKMRFGKRVDIKTEEPPEGWRETLVPRLILQPVIENCYKYGVESLLKGGIIKIEYEQSGNNLEIIIINNGHINKEKLEEVRNRLELPFELQRSVTGIINVNRRLKIMFGTDCGLTMDREGDYTVVRIRIKKMSKGRI